MKTPVPDPAPDFRVYDDYPTSIRCACERHTFRLTPDTPVQRCGYCGRVYRLYPFTKVYRPRETRRVAREQGRGVGA